MKKISLFILAIACTITLSSCKFGGEINVTPQPGDPQIPGLNCPECPKCPDPVTCPPEKICEACPTCPPPTEVIKEVPVEVIKEVIVEKEVPVIKEVIQIVEKLIEVPVEVIKTITVQAPKYKYTHTTPLTFKFDSTKKYKMDITSGIIKVYENDILILTKNPDKTEQI